MPESCGKNCAPLSDGGVCFRGGSERNGVGQQPINDRLRNKNEEEVNGMPSEAIRQITETEQFLEARKAAAEAEARRIVADAERVGQELAARVRADAAEQGRVMLRQAEKRAAVRAAEITGAAEAECLRQRRRAESRLEATAEWIAERVVKH